MINSRSNWREKLLDEVTLGHGALPGVTTANGFFIHYHADERPSWGWWGIFCGASAADVRFHWAATRFWSPWTPSPVMSVVRSVCAVLCSLKLETWSGKNLRTAMNKGRVTTTRRYFLRCRQDIVEWKCSGTVRLELIWECRDVTKELIIVLWRALIDLQTWNFRYLVLPFKWPSHCLSRLQGRAEWVGSRR